MKKNKSEGLNRKQKLDHLISLKINPFPSKSEKKYTILESSGMLEKNVITAGRISSIRSHGKSMFMDLTDNTGKIQIYFKYDEIGENNYKLLRFVDSGDILQVKGVVFKTLAGEMTIKVQKYSILCKALLPIPDKWYGLKDVETRYRKRYVDMLINEKARRNFKIRSDIVSNLRKFMLDNDFIEVETPILQAIPGGAAARPFITHYNILKQDMYLRIAPELYLKRMIIGGFEKVFEIGKSFRNEGLSHMHNPEFTMMEFYWAYQDYKGLMEFTQKLIPEVIKKTIGKLEVEYQGDIINFKPPYRTISFKDLIYENCKIDIYRYDDFDSLEKKIKEEGIKIDFRDIKVWAKLVDELYKKVARPKIVEPIFLIDHPIELTPLAKAHEDNPQIAQRFQLVCGKGIELVNAYTELNNPIEQDERFKEQVKMSKQGWDESAMMDSDFIEALKYGLPPTAGWGMGIERMAMLLTDQHSIKEVIPFPTLRNKNE